MDMKLLPPGHTWEQDLKTLWWSCTTCGAYARKSNGKWYAYLPVIDGETREDLS